MNKLSRSLFAHTSRSDSQIDALDGLRGIAVLFVILSHLGEYKMNPIPWVNFVGAGKVGVWLFYVLSAFLLTTQFLERADRLFTVPLWVNYVVRRVLRIYPLYTIVLVTSCLCSATGYFVPLSWREVGDHLLLQKGNSIFWTIPVEVKYYGFLPVVVLLGVCVLRRRWWAIGTALALVVTVYVYHPLPFSRIGLWVYLPVFLAGSCAAFFHQTLARYGDRPARPLRWASEVVAWALLALLIAMTPGLWSHVVGHEVPLRHFHRAWILFGVLWAVFLLSALHGTGWMKRLLSLPALRFVGMISFSLYLWHVPIINIVRTHVHARTPAAFAALAAIFIVATVSYFLIERPLMRVRIPMRRAARTGVVGGEV